MIAYWQLTPNGWTCSAVGTDYEYTAADMIAAWLYMWSQFWGMSYDAMRYYPA